MKKVLLLLFAAATIVACQKEESTTTTEVDTLQLDESWLISGGDFEPLSIKGGIGAPKDTSASTSKDRPWIGCGPTHVDLVRTPGGTPGEEEALTFLSGVDEVLCDNTYRTHLLTIDYYDEVHQIPAFSNDITGSGGWDFAFRVDENLEIVPWSVELHDSFGFLIQPFLYHLRNGNVTGNVYENPYFLHAIDVLEEYSAREVSVSFPESGNTRSVFFPEGTTDVEVRLMDTSGNYWFGVFDSSLDTILNQDHIAWIEFRYWWVDGGIGRERFYFTQDFQPNLDLPASGVLAGTTYSIGGLEWNISTEYNNYRFTTDAVNNFYFDVPIASMTRDDNGRLVFPSTTIYYSGNPWPSTDTEFLDALIRYLAADGPRPYTNSYDLTGTSYSLIDLDWSIQSEGDQYVFTTSFVDNLRIEVDKSEVSTGPDGRLVFGHTVVHYSNNTPSVVENTSDLEQTLSWIIYSRPWNG